MTRLTPPLLRKIIETTATNVSHGGFLPHSAGYTCFADLDGTEARRFLESAGYTVVSNRDIGTNGLAVTACGLRLSTNGYVYRKA